MVLFATMALLATLGIFLPSFVFVALTAPLLPRLRRSLLLAAMLDGVNVAAVGLMAAVVVVLARDAMVDEALSSVGLVAQGRDQPFSRALAGIVGAHESLVPSVRLRYRLR